MNNNSECGIPYGYPRLDAVTGGMKPRELILVGGRPGMGKTSFAVNVAYNLAQAGLKTLFLSLEADKQTIQARYPFADEAQNLISIIDNPKLSISDFAASLAEPNGSIFDLIIVDYLQLQRSPGKSKSECKIAVSEAVRGLWRLENETDVPILTYSQWPRECELRANRRPSIYDFCYAAMNDMDWDTILFLYRDGYYLDRDNPECEEATENSVEVIVVKHPETRPETTTLRWNPCTRRITGGFGR